MSLIDKMYDVIIVGAGPAGSTAGYFLSKFGIKCLLLDKANFPRTKPCGGAISPRAIEKFPFLLDLMENQSLEGDFHHLSPEGDMTIAVSKEQPLMYFIRRTKFDKQLLDLAKNSGVEVLERARVVKIQELKEKVMVTTEKGDTLESKFLLGADGVNSLVRKFSGMNENWRKNRLALLLMQEVECNLENMNELYSTRQIFHVHLSFGTSMGYGWVFPKRNHVNFGFGQLINEENGSDILARFKEYIVACQQRKQLPLFPQSLPRPLAWTIQTGGPMKKFAAGRILLLGDAAGFVHPVSGEGIIYAIWSAQIAANSIKKTLQNPSSEKLLAREYSSQCWKEFATYLHKMDKIHNLNASWMKLYFKLASHDQKLRELLICLMDGTYSYSKMQRNIVKRVLIGIFKGNLWKNAKK